MNIDKRLELIKRNLAEIVDEAELRKLLKEKKNPVVQEKADIEYRVADFTLPQAKNNKPREPAGNERETVQGRQDGQAVHCIPRLFFS